MGSMNGLGKCVGYFAGCRTRAPPPRVRIQLMDGAGWKVDWVMGRGYDGDIGEMRSGEIRGYMFFKLLGERRKWKKIILLRRYMGTQIAYLATTPRGPPGPYSDTVKEWTCTMVHFCKEIIQSATPNSPMLALQLLVPRKEYKCHTCKGVDVHYGALL